MKKKFGMTTGLLMLAVLIVSMSIGNAYAKYVTQKTLEENTVTITANIGTIVLQEHLYHRESDGSYTITNMLLPIADDPETAGDESTIGNEYILLPGYDIPKDPHVVITKLDALPVYVYVEVVDGLGTGSGISYTLSKDWTYLDITGPNGGKVYAYKDSITKSETIYILKTIDDSNDNTIQVSQKLNKAASGLNLTFYAYMYQTAAGTDAKSVYTTFNPPKT